MKHRPQRGFSLIELLISIVVGLVITGAVVSFIASTVTANNATMRATKLSQELRTLTELISRDLKRARGMIEPVSNMGTGCSTTAGDADACEGLAVMQSVTLAPNDTASNCITYGYQTVDTTATPPVVNSFRAVRRVVTGTIGTIVMVRDNAALDCASTGDELITISSNLINITALRFIRSSVRQDQIDIEISGSLRNDVAAVAQTFRTSVYLRSGSI